MARSFGRKSRVGQLSMIAGAIAEPSISASDWVAKMTEAFFLRSVFSHSRSCPAKLVIIEREPAFIDDQQGRPAVEPVLDAVEQIGKHGRRGAGPISPSVSKAWTSPSPRRSASASSRRPKGPPRQ